MKCENKGHYVYEHISPSGKVYVGQTNNLQKRWFPSSYKGCMVFYKAIIKYGWNNLTHRIVARKLTQEEANYLEKRLIGYYKSKGLSYNITDGGEGTMGYTPWNKGTKGIMPSPWNKGVSCSEETRAKISKSKLGRKLGKQSPLHIKHKAEKRKIPILQFDIDGRYIREWDSAKDVEVCRGFNRKTIGRCLTDDANSAFGYIWIYKKDFNVFHLLDKIEKFEKFEKGIKYIVRPKVPLGIEKDKPNNIVKWLNTI